MNESEIGFNECENNEIVIVIDSQDQEDFSVVEEIVNKENILIEGFLWEDRSILNQVDQINQIVGNNFNGIKEEKTPVKNTNQDYYRDDHIELEIINNLEEIESKNQIMNIERRKVESEDEAEDESENENEKESCIDIPKSEDLAICVPEHHRIDVPNMDLKLGSCIINHFPKKSKSEVLLSKYQISIQIQSFRLISYLNKVKNIMTQHFQRSQRYNRMIILDLKKKKYLEKKRSIISHLKMESKYKNQENDLLENEQNIEQSLSLEDMILQKKMEEYESPAKDLNGTLVLSKINNITIEDSNQLNLTTEAVLPVHLNNIEQTNSDYSKNDQNFEVIEKNEIGNCYYLESVDIESEAKKNFELSLNLVLSPQVSYEEQKSHIMNKTLESDPDLKQDINVKLDLKPNSETLFGSKFYIEPITENETIKDDLGTKLVNSILDEKSVESQKLEILKQPENNSHKLELSESKTMIKEKIDFKFESHSIYKKTSSQGADNNETAINHEGITQKQSDNDEEGFNSPLLIEDNDDILVELIQDHEEDEINEDQTNDSTGFESIESFELTRKGSQISQNSMGIISFEDNNIHIENEKKQNYAKSIDDKEVHEAINQGDNNDTDSFENSIKQIEIKLDVNETRQDDTDQLDKPNHEKDIFQLEQSLQRKKENNCSPFNRKYETYTNNKSLRSSPYHSLRGEKNKSFGVFDKLISLAQNRSIARPISKDLSTESIRAIEIIKKSRKTK